NETSRDLESDPIDLSPDEIFERPPVEWHVEPQSYGFYLVQAQLLRDGEVIVETSTSFAIMDLIDEIATGEFGWSIANGISRTNLGDLPNIAHQAGINWVKYPLWRSVSGEDAYLPGTISDVFEQMLRRRITPIGLLNQ